MKQQTVLTMDNVPQPHEDHSHVIPQIDAAQNLYRLCIADGMTPREAAMYVLRLSTNHIMEKK